MTGYQALVKAAGFRRCLAAAGSTHGDVHSRVKTSTYSTRVYGDVPAIHCIATFDQQSGATAVFLVNCEATEDTVMLD